MSGGMIMPGDLDAALCDMIREAEKTIRTWIDGEGGGHQGSFELSDIDWDHPAAVPEGVIYSDDGRVKRAVEASHAIGFVCGVAAALDVTPMTLLESYDERETTKRALGYYAGVSDPDFREDAERALRLFDRMSTPKPTEAAPRAKRSTAKRRQKIQIPPKKK